MELMNNDIDKREIERILFEISSLDFLENEIENQIEYIFESNKRNYLEFYLEKYKFVKSNIDVTSYPNIEDLDDMKEEMKYNKNRFITDILLKVCDKFDIQIDGDENNTKIAKTLYKFFVIDYKENLKIFFLNIIKKNKQSIIKELKARKRNRDIGLSASKSKYINTNDAIIINNLEFILMDIISSMEFDGDFIDYIINYDDNINYMNISKLIEKEKIILTQETFECFISPFINREEGYTDIISEIVIMLVENTKQRELDLF